LIYQFSPTNERNIFEAHSKETRVYRDIGMKGGGWIVTKIKIYKNGFPAVPEDEEGSGGGREQSFTSLAAVADAVAFAVVLAVDDADLLVLAASICCADTDGCKT